VADPKKPEPVPHLTHYRCRIDKSRNRALESWTTVQAQTPADAKEKYLEAMGIIGVEAPLKVEVQEV
jgi:hypothetical protein